MKTPLWHKTALPAGVAAAVLLYGGTTGANPADESGGKSWTMASHMYADRKARRIGDILTVTVQESATSAKSAQTSTKKSASATGSASLTLPMKGRTFSWGSSSVPAYDLASSSAFDGGGTTANSDSFIASISVTVRDVMPNGNMMIEGTRVVAIRDDRVTIVLSGMVRPEDIDSNNTILSTMIADASVRYSTTGTLANSQEKGFFFRVIDWLNIF